MSCSTPSVSIRDDTTDKSANAPFTRSDDEGSKGDLSKHVNGMDNDSPGFNFISNINSTNGDLLKPARSLHEPFENRQTSSGPDTFPSTGSTPKAKALSCGIKVQFFVEDMDNSTITIMVKAACTFMVMKEIIEARLSVPASQQRWTVGTRQLTSCNGNMTVGALELEGKTVVLKLGLVGGMQASDEHDGLAPTSAVSVSNTNPPTEPQLGTMADGGTTRPTVDARVDSVSRSDAAATPSTVSHAHMCVPAMPSCTDDRANYLLPKVPPCIPHPYK